MCRRIPPGWVGFLTFLVVAAIGRSQAPTVAIRIVEGDRAINSIKLRRGHDPVVQVADSAGEPVVGAAVTFLLPASGPSATFAVLQKRLAAMSDVDFGTMTARDFSLYQSQLSPKGSKYTKLHSFPLQ